MDISSNSHTYRLILSDGTTFIGRSPIDQSGTFYGEVVFTTGMTGYPETLTDPSYAGQIIVFSYPLIGNYGIPSPDHWESAKIHAKGVVINETCLDWSHHTGIHSFLQWLKVQNVPVIVGVDTRALTKLLRESGTMQGAITDNKKLQFAASPSPHLVSEVSPRQVQTYGNGAKKIIAIDCGLKENIMRSLMRFPVSIKRVPHDYDYTNEEYDGIFISNGPGDPTQCVETVAHLQKAFQQGKPTFGICLGTQLMALAAGAKTYKLAYGHRGQNQPVIDTESKRCYITSQNHGYAIDPATLPKEWKVTFKNLNDDSVEGIAHDSKPFFSVQFHPEANPGPTDTLWMFEKFYHML